MWQLLYSYIFLPMLIGIVAIISIFSPKIRKGFLPRLKSVSRIKKYAEQIEGSHRVVLVHAASMGEYEHIRPVLEELKKNFDTLNIVSFFSPSGYENVKPNPALDFTFYTPPDFQRNWRKIYELLRPKMIIVSKHDVWAGMIWQARNKQIPVYLVNASVSESSSRLRPLVKHFLQNVYRQFNRIFTITEEDKQRFEKQFKLSNIDLLGDTKYDQVLLRKENALSTKILPEWWDDQRQVFLAGSIWPEDERHLLPALKDCLHTEKDLKLILVPHQPTVKAVERLKKSFAEFSCQTFTDIADNSKPRVLIIDAVGYLAGLYKYASVAYVGGSFQQGIHNTMEPAIYGIPVMYGPVHRNSSEAIAFAGDNGGIVVQNSQAIKDWTLRLLQDQSLMKEKGAKSYNFSSNKTGATKKLIEQWRSLLAEN